MTALRELGWALVALGLIAGSWAAVAGVVALVLAVIGAVR